MNNQEKGLLYEKFVKDFIIQKIGRNAYLWNECPENILIEKGLINKNCYVSISDMLYIAIFFSKLDEFEIGEFHELNGGCYQKRILYPEY